MVNMPVLPKGISEDEFWKRYKQERMVELAFGRTPFLGSSDVGKKEGLLLLQKWK